MGSQKNRKRKSTGKWHKWLGLGFSFFILIFAFSGIILNHRKALSALDIPRSWLPKNYQYTNWNNASVKGSLKIAPDSVLLYGGNGIWLTNENLSSFKSFNDGLKKGADNRITNHIIKTDDNLLFAVTTFDLYQYDNKGKQWINFSDKLNTPERLVDVAYHNDSLVVLSRSHAYISPSPYNTFEKVTLQLPKGEKHQVSLFKTLWTLHSGELFGNLGKFLVDLLGVTTIILCITGILIFISPKLIRKRRKKNLSTFGFIKLLRSSIKWHNKPGATLFFLLLLLCLSGMFLRPPLLISIIYSKHHPLSFTTQDKENPYHDKLRSIRYDHYTKDWLLYTSDGLLAYKELDSSPLKVENTPPISVMGLQVFEQKDSTEWIIGSFSGLYIWNREQETSKDYFTGESPQPTNPGPPIISNPTSGFSSDFTKDITFNYFNGAQSKMAIPAMPPEIKHANISLWHISLEAHTGRIYTFLPEIAIILFIPIAGTLFLIIVISGYIVYRRRYKKRL